MPWQTIFFAISLAGLSIGSYTDIKQRIVKDKLTYSLIAIGLAGHILWAIAESNPMIAAYSIIATVGGFGFAYVLWKMGVWAGGDVKLLTGIAALNPINPFILGKLGITLGAISMPVQLPIFPITLFVFSVFAMVPYGSLIALNGLRKMHKERSAVAQDLGQKAVQTVQGSLSIVGITWALSLLVPYFAPALWLTLPALIVFGLIKNNKARWAIAVLLFATSAYYGLEKSITSFAILFVVFFGIYIMLKLYSLSKKVMRENKKISELEEGEIPVESFVEMNGKVERLPPLEIKRIINYFRANSLNGLLEYMQPKGRMIANSRRARGLLDEEIEELKALVKEKKLEDRIEIKLSAPFVPAFLIAYLLLNIVGDLIWGLFF